MLGSFFFPQSPSWHWGRTVNPDAARSSRACGAMQNIKQQSLADLEQRLSAIQNEAEAIAAEIRRRLDEQYSGLGTAIGQEMSKALGRQSMMERGIPCTLLSTEKKQ